MSSRKLILCATCLFLAGPSSAGVLADLNSMFLSNDTSAQQIKTRDRNAFFAGSFSMRTPIKSVNMIAFDPPRLDAGCGGIDLYGGSFSFINGQQLIQIFRQVAANAAGLAFKAAIKMISPSLDSLMTEFQALLQNLNNLAKNSCQLSQAIVDSGEKMISGAVNAEGSVGGTSSGLFSDAFSGLTNYLADANGYFAKQSKNNPKSGNQVVKSIVASGSSGVMGMAGLPNIDGSSDDATKPNSLNNRLLVSVTGYQIAGVPCQKYNEDGVANSSGSAAGGVGKIECEGVALITLDDLIKGGGANSTRPDLPLKLYTCLNPEGSTSGGADNQPCTQMRKDDFSYAGIQAWVNASLFGSVDPATSVDATSIVGRFNAGVSIKENNAFTNAQKAFIAQSGQPLIALLGKTSNPDLRVSIANRLSPLIVDCVAARMGEAIYKGALHIQDANGYVLSEQVKKNIERVRTDYLLKQEVCRNNDKLRAVLEEINLSTRARASGSVK